MFQHEPGGVLRLAGSGLRGGAHQLDTKAQSLRWDRVFFDEHSVRFARTASGRGEASRLTLDTEPKKALSRTAKIYRPGVEVVLGLDGEL